MKAFSDTICYTDQQFSTWNILLMSTNEQREFLTDNFEPTYSDLISPYLLEIKQKGWRNIMFLLNLRQISHVYRRD